MDLSNGVTSELRALLALRFTRGLGSVRIKALADELGSAEAALAASRSQLAQVSGLDRATIAGIGAQEAWERADEELRRARMVGVSLLGVTDPAYPVPLRALYDPPPVLWARGDLKGLAALAGADARSIGIVGTRRCTPQGLAFTELLARGLASANVVVISGLARGIDTAAHRAAVDAGGLSVGVLGCGADRIYPRENEELARRLIVLSEHPVGTPPEPHYFPPRNRIIAGLSQGIVVVEAGEKSGALITAANAREAGRVVFAVPGRPVDPTAAGPNDLIRDGAVLTRNAQDILDEFVWMAGPARLDPLLEGREALVYKALRGDLLLDDVVAACGLSAAEALQALMMLTLAGHARELPGGRYTRS